MTRRWILLFLALFSPLSGLAEPAIEFVPLMHQPAQTLIPMLAPLLGQDALISPAGTGLLLKAETARRAELIRLIGELDRPARRLLLQLSNVNPAGNQHTHSYRTHSRWSPPLQLQTLDGHQVYISQQERRRLDRGGALTVVGPLFGFSHQADYQQFQRGLMLTPRVVGDKIRVEISAWDSQPAGLSGGSVGLRLVSVIEIEPGLWSAIGSSGHNVGESARSGDLRGSTRSRREQAFLLKVELLP
ncbi:hypothetical protein [endosymbiont of Ridgeia piscesae]|jgi:hypothetical protein|uniref:Type II and III secretion system protein n=1 Tax=endosymbiont of Ridgeia piscesae TaxID=54398 RepID=A0A0T5ZCD4_9GAMM|nr:hypothetical protein [endosymbiont of Ridgeia piscesae]KRT55949.1 hypothetical protein Ga0074115_1285 [endosymbiont of Ridgeia piscesae]KRT60149.1 hypothetical protein Ga0076813_16792 [endosymbiont of Ridgeia piscesae]